MNARLLLAFVGGTARRQVSFTLQVAALIWGVLSEGSRPSTWRRTLRGSFRFSLTRLVTGSLGTTAVTAILVGLSLVFEALYWLRAAGEEEQIGRLLVLVVVREVAPLLIGIILLGRGGSALVAELGSMTTQGEVGILRAEGLDVFQYLVLPRAAAFAVASFTLGTIFILMALISGFMTGSLLGSVSGSFLGFVDAVLRATNVWDLVVLPAKLLMTGLVVALVSCATGLGAGDHDVLATLLPRGYTRGITGVLTVSIVLSTLL